LVITFINISESKQAEEKLNETDQLNQLLINLSTDVIIKLSTDWKILEFNSVAEEVFEIKRNDAVNQNYIELLLPEPMRHKAEKQMNQLLKQAGKNKIKMKMLAAGDHEMEIEWTVDVLFNNLKLPSGVLITTKK